MEKLQGDTVVLLGSTGAGKSELANTLAGDPKLFVTSSLTDSCTSETSYKNCQWFGTETQLTLIDTPGYGDSKNRDEKNFLEMVDKLKGNVKQVKAFVMTFNSAAPRIDNQIQEMLRYFEKTFKKKMWENTIVVCTRWGYDKKAERHRRSQNLTKEDREKGIYDQLKTLYDISQPLPIIFLDSLDARYGEEEQQDQLKLLKSLVQNFTDFNLESIEYQLTKEAELKKQFDEGVNKNKELLEKASQDKALLKELEDYRKEHKVPVPETKDDLLKDIAIMVLVSGATSAVGSGLKYLLKAPFIKSMTGKVAASGLKSAKAVSSFLKNGTGLPSRCHIF